MADDAGGDGKLIDLLRWYDRLVQMGERFGYHGNRGKRWLILRSTEKKDEAYQLFEDKINITTERKQHLGAAIGSNDFKNQYCKQKVNKCLQELETLCKIAQSKLYAAYIAYVKAFYSKYIHFM